MDREAWHDQQRAHMTETIRRFGCAIQYVGGGMCDRPGCDASDDDGPPFAYTVGLFGMNHPELLIVGTGPEDAGLVLDGLSRRVRSGEDLLPGMMLRVEGWEHRIVPESVPNPGEIVLLANDYYHRPAEHSVPVLQLTYDDAEGRFPWDDGYIGSESQPRPGSFTA
jgi:hypothetical protein